MKKVYHKENIENFRFLITGGAGFIGSHLVEYLLRHGAKEVRVLDNLSNGSLKNLEHLKHYPNYTFIEGDICDFDTCKKAIEGINYVSHQAALGSVPRSIKNPILSHNSNVNGFLNLLTLAKESKSLINFVYASSSSVYGDIVKSPKKEGLEGNLLSPYALTKSINELYAQVYHKVYGLKSVGLRYFNVFGPRQDPNNPYAAVIPLFCTAAIKNETPIINGNKKITRDFTYIENVVQANIITLLNPKNGSGVFNVACGKSTDLISIIKLLEGFSQKTINYKIGPKRSGDIEHSLADISSIKKYYGYNPEISFSEGLKFTYEWLLKQ